MNFGFQSDKDGFLFVDFAISTLTMANLMILFLTMLMFFS